MSQQHSKLEFELIPDPEAAADEQTLPPGTLVAGKYVIKRALGKGGTGTVYEAQHESVGHRVALKLINASRLDRPETLARFRQEAHICGAIRHPNVGQVYDFGTLEGGQPYMILELHEGRSLADVLDESILPIPAVIEITRQLLAGLSAVHHAGIVHRDVKPDNAMLVRSVNGDIVVKVVDFGISKIVRADIQDRGLTHADSFLGSPDYMAPEQLRGNEVDARTDLYATGVLLYEAITGRTPFDGESLTDLVAAIVRDPVKPPSELRDECPKELDQLIMKAISRDPAARFESAEEMSRQLAEVQRIVRYAPDPGIARLQEPMLRRANRTTRTRGRRVVSRPAPSAVQAVIGSDPVALPTTTTVNARQGHPAWMRTGIIAAPLLLGLLTFVALRGAREDAPEPPAPARAPVTASSEVAPATSALEPPALAAALHEVGEAPAAPERVAAKRQQPAKRVRRAVRTSASAKRATPATKAQGAPQSAAPGPSIQQLFDEATAAFVLGQMPRARALYEQVLERSPARADAWRGLGLAASRMGQRTDAARAFQRYLDLRPNAPDAERIREQLAKLR